MRTSRAVLIAVGLGLVGAGVASAQEPVPPLDLPTPGSGTVEGDVIVTKQEQVKVKVRCILGDVPCSGSVTLQTRRAVSTGKDKARRVITVASGSYGTLAPGEAKTVTLALKRDARKRVRAYESTDVVWNTFNADGVKNFLFIPHTTKLISRAAR